MNDNKKIRTYGANPGSRLGGWALWPPQSDNKSTAMLTSALLRPPALGGMAIAPPPLFYSAHGTGLGSTMPEKRTKTLSYRRAEWFAPALVFQTCINQALGNLKTISDRTIISADQYIRCAKVRAHGKGGILLHITVETPGESASVVPKVTAASTELDLKSEKPPTGGEWLDGDAFLYVKEDHVCLCTTGLRDGAIRLFFVQLFAKAKMQKNTGMFDLMKVADMTKVKMLKKQGVKELEIRATLYKATADYHNRKSQVMGWTGAIGKTMKAFLGKPHDVNPDSLRVALSFKSDMRFGSKAVALGEAELEALAADVVKSVAKGDKDYDYVIKTGSGQRITLDEIFMKSTVQIQSDGKTVQCEKAWRELTKFYESLEEGGALEE